MALNLPSQQKKQRELDELDRLFAEATKGLLPEPSNMTAAAMPLAIPFNADGSFPAEIDLGGEEDGVTTVVSVICVPVKDHPDSPHPQALMECCEDCKQPVWVAPTTIKAFGCTINRFICQECGEGEIAALEAMGVKMNKASMTAEQAAEMVKDIEELEKALREALKKKGII